jgi:hypothetical protein
MVQYPSANAKIGPIAQPLLRRFAATLQPGQTDYRVVHQLGTEDVIVQTRIAGRIREGGISVVDANTVQIVFGGVLNEPMQVIVIG